MVVFLSDNGACAEWDPWGFDGKSGPDNVLHRGAELQQMGGPGTFHSAGSGWANASNTPWRLYKHFNHEGNRAVTDGRWKLVALRDQDWELYDLSVDRTETNDLSDRFPERVSGLSDAWRAWADVNQVTPLPSDYQVEYLRATR